MALYSQYMLLLLGSCSLHHPHQYQAARHHARAVADEPVVGRGPSGEPAQVTLGHSFDGVGFQRHLPEILRVHPAGIDIVQRRSDCGERDSRHRPPRTAAPRGAVVAVRGTRRLALPSLRIRDTRNDGWRVAIHWRLSDGTRRGLCVNKAGSWADDKQCNKNLPENRTLELRLGVCDGGSDAACDSVGEFSRFGPWAETSTS